LFDGTRERALETASALDSKTVVVPPFCDEDVTVHTPRLPFSTLSFPFMTSSRLEKSAASTRALKSILLQGRLVVYDSTRVVAVVADRRLVGKKQKNTFGETKLRCVQ